MARNNKSEIEKLKGEVERLKKELKKRKKYGLVWEEKPEEVVEMCKEKLPVLKEVKNKEIITDKDKPTRPVRNEISNGVNLLIEGDNYHALSVLNYTHAKKIDVIYIDPPYNTGSSKWIYNNKYVDSEDAFRHSKWLSFMFKRLKLSRNLLKDNGVIITTIDDYEIHSLGLLMDEIFGENNRMSILVIESNPRGRTSNAFFATSHEYYLFYGRNALKCKIEEQPLNEDQSAVFKYKDDISYYRLLPMRKSGAASRRNDRPKQFYPIYVNKNTLKLSMTKSSNNWEELLPVDESGEERVWKLGRENCEKYIKSGDVIAKRGRKGIKLYQKDRIKSGRKPKTMWIDPKYDASAHGTNLIAEILGKRNIFEYPKSLYAVIDSLKTIIRKNKNALVLDFFAGSGTTGHAVLELNKEDGGNRKFILCTNNEDNNGNGYKIAEDICYPRIKKVIGGYKNLKGEKVAGLGGNLKYFKTDFVDYAEPTDKNKIKLTEQATEMLCIREGTFDEVRDPAFAKASAGKQNNFKIFKNANHYTGIIFDQAVIPAFKKAIKDIRGKFSVYVFSLGDEDFQEEFADLNKKRSVAKSRTERSSGARIQLFPIPEAILRVYRRIFK